MRYRETVDHDRVDVSGVVSTVDNSDKLKILLVPCPVAGVEVMVVQVRTNDSNADGSYGYVGPLGEIAAALRPGREAVSFTWNEHLCEVETEQGIYNVCRQPYHRDCACGCGVIRFGVGDPMCDQPAMVQS